MLLVAFGTTPHFREGETPTFQEVQGDSGTLVVKNLPASAGDEARVQSLRQEDPLEEGMATHSSIPAWRVPSPGEPGGLWSIGSQRVGYD